METMVGQALAKIGPLQASCLFLWPLRPWVGLLPFSFHPLVGFSTLSHGNCSQLPRSVV